MKTGLLVTVILILTSTMAFGEERCRRTFWATGGAIQISSDTQGMDCNLWDQVAGLCSYHIIHKKLSVPGAISAATASQFAAPKPACFLATYLSDGPIFAVTLGNSQTGVAIGYGTCITFPIHILTMNFFCMGTTAPCCEYVAGPDPSLLSGKIEMVDCDGNLHYGCPLCAVINPDESCPCWATPTEETTWGKVKSLYAE